MSEPIRRALNIDPWGVQVDRFLGFETEELLELLRVLDTTGWSMEQALDILRAHGGDYVRLAAWREHFGLMAELGMELE
ncbi:MAG TPA: hypothetical protein VK736_06220 [Candidatus Binatia bacterium]|nr:hypothetical protein [Candidatus Binatia bacterium]